MVRRTLDRLESGELTLQEAIVMLRSLGNTYLEFDRPEFVEVRSRLGFME